jgi:hypothetical protein
MMRLSLLVILTCCSLSAQLGTDNHRRGLEDATFANCKEVLDRARSLATDIHEPAYFMELFPQSQPQRDTFLSETTAAQAAWWIAHNDPKTYRHGLFYFVKGSYTLRCRDTSGRYVKLSGPSDGEGPLDLDLPSGKAEIWHFFISPINMAHVFVITEAPLKTVDGDALMARVTKLLSARTVFLYVRNDPWFFGEVFDPLPFYFADGIKTATLQEYRASPTLTCYTGSGCGLGLSH